ncbi:hypothetical protein [Micromonospora sp. b486]|uniref:hypothetical protein n=1 Tax=Micromonospora sp. b486 TaxID=3053986 RepID=UPI00259CDD24|nr:hypothetical protein [Micromonospora sp. b486]MDM4784410.1 hypothetical protein [Micromonospora sp. b486]
MVLRGLGFDAGFAVVGAAVVGDGDGSGDAVLTSGAGAVVAGAATVGTSWATAGAVSGSVVGPAATPMPSSPPQQVRTATPLTRSTLIAAGWRLHHDGRGGGANGMPGWWGGGTCPCHWFGGGSSVTAGSVERRARTGVSLSRQTGPYRRDKRRSGGRLPEYRHRCRG